MEIESALIRPLGNLDLNKATDDDEVIIEDKSHGKKYIRGKILGKGGFAKCYEMRDVATGKLYAGKFVLKSSLTKAKAKQKLTNEIKIHRSTNHPNVVKFFQCFEDREYVYIILELCDNKSFMELMKKRKRLTESETKYYMLQILSAVHYLHKSNIIHRDLKLGNFFLSDKMELKIGDFGLAAQLLHPDERKTTICGTPNYIAPEMLNGKGEHGYEVDIWSLGVILYTLIVGRPPFETSDVKTTYNRIRAVTYDFPESAPISEQSKSLIRMILCVDPAQRPSLKDIANHAFFKTGYIPRAIPSSALHTVPHFQSDQTLPSAQSALMLFSQTPSSEPFDKENQPSASNPPIAQPSPYSLPSHSTPSIALASQTAAAKSLQSAMPTTTFASDASAQPRLFVRTNIFPTHEDGEGFIAASTPMATNTGFLTSSTDAQTPSATSMNIMERIGRSNSMSAAPEMNTNAFVDKRPRSTTIVDPVSNVIASAAETKVVEDANIQQGGNTGNKDVFVNLAVNEEAARLVDDAQELDEDDRGNLTHIHRHLTISFARAPSPEKDAKGREKDLASGAHLLHPERSSSVLWLTKWVDYSNKYGLGYQLSDGVIGVFFNDYTKIALSTDGDNFEYVPYRKTASSTEERESHRISDFPPALQKKVTLLKYFKNYLTESSSSTPLPSRDARTSDAKQLIYVKKWLRTKHAIIFRLSNRNVQVNFFDHTKIVLSSEAQVVTYVNKKRELSTHALATVMRDPNSELVSRLKYTKDVLFHLISKNK